MPAIRGEDFDFTVSLLSQSTGQILASPTIAAADFEISTDSGAYTSLTNTPTVPQDGIVLFSLTSSEVGQDYFTVKMIDASGGEWKDMYYHETVQVSESIDTSAIADAVWDEPVGGHNLGGSTGKFLRLIKEGVVSVDGSVDDPAATTTTFITNLTQSTDGFYHDKVIVFANGSDLSGQARHIENYNGTTKSITVSVPFTSAPNDGDEFIILSTHEHSLNEIGGVVWDQTLVDHLLPGSTGAALQEALDHSNSGSGSISHTITVCDNSNNPLDGVAVWVTTDSAGTNVVAGTSYTDTFGNVTFMLDAGSYYGWQQLAGYNFTNPTSFTVS